MPGRFGTLSAVTRHLTVLVNPTSGRGLGARLAEPVRDHLRTAGIDVRLLLTRDAEHATQLAAEAVTEGVDGLVVVGGDGMVHLVAQSLAHTEVPLGVVPAGTGNDLARALGIPRTDPMAATDIVVAGQVRSLDAGTAGGRMFTTVLCSGFDARVAERTRTMSWPRGRRRYDVAILAELRQLRPVPYTLELDGETWETEAFLVAAGNTASYGGGLRMCEGADPHDGLLEVAVIAPLKLTELARLLPKLSKGAHLGHPAVQMRRVKRISIAAPDQLAYADGERVGAVPVTVEAVPDAMRMFLPVRR